MREMKNFHVWIATFNCFEITLLHILLLYGILHSFNFFFSDGFVEFLRVFELCGGFKFLWFVGGVTAFSIGIRDVYKISPQATSICEN
jgi:hypothetical protein